ncbi:MAG: hypothetical protein QME96_05595 [Myxococcota bacterium]|nr:hypothetical protein [Myxococcota bacterium]
MDRHTESTEASAETRHRPWPRALPREGARLARTAGVDWTAVREMYREPWTFFSMCVGEKEDESVGFYDPTPTQRLVLETCAAHRWVMVDKYRQAKVSTCLALGVLLRDCMYLESVKGVLIADTFDTAEMLFERIMAAYKNLPDGVRVPLAEEGRQQGTRHLRFEHGGNIRVLSLRTDAPAVGRGVDRMLVTEFGEARWQAKVATHLFPTANKRPNARVIVESTPGRAGSHFEGMWRKACEGKSRFFPLFLEWWKDETCRVGGGGFGELGAEELAYCHGPPAKRGITRRAMEYRRVAIASEFLDPRLFDTKYPPDPLGGWIGSENPALPEAVLRGLMDGAVMDGSVRIGASGFCEIEPPDDRDCYVLTADPAGFGRKGDPSGATVWSRGTGRQVAFWSGREMPNSFARRVHQGANRYSTKRAPCALVVESNASACLGALLDRGAVGWGEDFDQEHGAEPAGISGPARYDLYWTGKQHPGWFATEKRRDAGLGRLVRLLTDGSLIPRSVGLLHQLLAYDGSGRREADAAVADETGGRRHHFDLARTALIAADVLVEVGFVERDGDGGKSGAPEAVPEGVITWDMVTAFLDGKMENRRRSGEMGARGRLGRSAGRL